MDVLTRALVVRGGWEGHVPVEATDLFIPYLKEKGYEVTVSDTTESYLDLDGVDLERLIRLEGPQPEGRVVHILAQIAGALARRIVNYLHVGQKVEQSAEMGFIKFGSRVDVLLPPGAKVQVGLDQVVQGGVTVLAKWD